MINLQAFSIQYAEINPDILVNELLETWFGHHCSVLGTSLGMYVPSILIDKSLIIGYPIAGPVHELVT